MKHNLPTFLGIGAQKAGTTWLYTQLSPHPEIWIPPKKELHFFDDSSRYLGKNTFSTSSPLARTFSSNPSERKRMINDTKKIGKYLLERRLLTAQWWIQWTFGYYNDEWYSRLFSQGASYQASGEITPAYSILQDEDVARIKAINPDMKLIFMIRHPLERAWSAIRFYISKGWLKAKLDAEDDLIQALKQPRIALRGDYERTLEIYLKHFDSQQILVCFSDAIACDPVGLLLGITEFLGVSSYEKGTIDHQTLVNASPKSEIPPKVKDYLIETYAPMINQLAKNLGSYARVWHETGRSYNQILDQDTFADTLSPTLHP